MKIFTPEDRDEYQKLWSKYEMSILQSWQWGEFKSNSSELLRVKIGSYPLSIYIKSVPFVGWKFGYIPHGGPQKMFTAKAAEELKQVCEANNLSHIIIDPYVSELGQIEGFEPSSEPWVQSQDTITTDLSLPVDDIMAGMRKKHRQYIRKSEKMGLFFETDDSEEGVKRFSEILKKQFTTKSYIAYPPDYFERLWKVFGSKQAHIHIAIDAKEDVGAYLVIDGSSTTYQFYGGTTKTGRDKYAAYLLTWEAMKAAKERGMNFYDQWGTAKWDGNDFDKSDEKYGISTFKDGFKGRKVHYADQLVVVNNSSRYKMYKKLMGLHRSYISLRKKLK